MFGIQGLELIVSFGVILFSSTFVYIRSSVKPYGSFYLTFIRPLISYVVTSSLLQRIRWSYSLFFKRKSKIPTLNAFICSDDPQSFALIQCLKLMATKYKTRVLIHILPNGVQGWDKSAVDPRPWILADSREFCKLYEFVSPTLSPDLSAQTITYELMSASDNNIDKVFEILSKYWNESIPKTSINESDKTSENLEIESKLQSNEKLLRKLGYYGPGVVEMEGEFYAPNRLHHLERRLLEEEHIKQLARITKVETISEKLSVISGLIKNAYSRSIIDKFDSRILFWRQIVDYNSLQKPSQELNLPSKTVDLFYSFRSPYSQLAVTQLKSICNAYGLTLRIRVMMPMVMRGLKVPFSKVLFIVTDCAREARLSNITFGKCCDPIEPNGIPIKRVLDAFIVAKKCGKEVEYVASFAELVWGKGVDVGTDAGLHQVVEQAGMVWEDVKQALGKEETCNEWTAITANNREYLYSKGLWGVPCVEYNGHIVWGQDKLYQILRLIDPDSLTRRQ